MRLMLLLNCLLTPVMLLNLEAKVGAADTADIIRNPDRFAWQVFAEISKPADGEGATQWETWALARKVYEDPDLSFPNDEEQRRELFKQMAEGDSGDRFDPMPIQQQILLQRQQEGLFLINPEGFIQPARVLDNRTASEERGADVDAFDPHVTFTDDDPSRENDEVRMNYDTFVFLLENGLHSVEGQEEMLNQRWPVDFPVNSKEIKAAWKKLGENDIPDTYHTHEFNGALWGLTALHITTKDLPNWVWATWEHKDNPQREAIVPSRDLFGAKTEEGRWIGPSEELKKLFLEEGLDSKWENYVLRGTQIDFVTATGEPTLLATSIIEEGFQDTSSCITCHARAARGPRLRRSDASHMLAVFASAEPPVGHIGSPDPNWFTRGTSPPAQKYWQMDFVWSTIRAQRRGSKDAVAGDVPTTPSQSATGHPLEGEWTYRALLNEPNKSVPLDQLELGKGTLHIDAVESLTGRFHGRLMIEEGTTEAPLQIEGMVSDGQPPRLRFRGKGTGASNKDWLYDYLGYQLPDDLKFVAPRDWFPDHDAEESLGRLLTLTGQVVRVKDHPGSDGEVHPAGQMGTWYAIKKKALAGEDK